MTCTHIDQITTKLVDLSQKLRDGGSFLYEEKGPYVNWRDIDNCVGSINVSGGIADHISAVSTIQNLMRRIMEVDAFTLKTIKGQAIADYAIEILNLIRECNCSSEAGNRARDLCNDYNKVVNDYNGLQDRYNDLVNRLNDLRDEYNELRSKSENTRTERERERVNNTQRIATLEQEKVGLQNQLGNIRQQLTNSENKIARIENRLSEKDRELQELINRLSDLRIENNNRSNQLQETHRELVRVQEERNERITPLELQDLLTILGRRDEENISLRGRLGQSQESEITERLRNREQRLENFTHRLGIEWEQVQLLRDICNELVRSRRAGDMNSIRENQSVIEEIKQNFLQARVRLGDVQEICEKCEEIAQLNLQLEQQFEARIEVPLRPNRY